jgi:hypothetical protein
LRIALQYTHTHENSVNFTHQAQVEKGKSTARGTGI